MLSLRQQRTIGSSKCLWGFCFHVEQRLTSRLTVAAGGPPTNVPATNLGYSREKRREPPFIMILMRKIVNDRGRLIGPPGKYERWSSGASTRPVDIRVKLWALVPYWEPHEFVVLTPLLLEYFRCRYLEFHRLRLKLGGGSSGCYTVSSYHPFSLRWSPREEESEDFKDILSKQRENTQIRIHTLILV
ncbi:hypothetical protein PIB30_049044 [Stylosanthes scabra]|uniref:Uncharacterized protein n=1 Tax=Stylosanthes scabra TaxID=79078 RepID=A0ABU6UFY7_9FABA|nr:hypothetical protein [Stylosanthes scabra]